MRQVDPDALAAGLAGADAARAGVEQGQQAVPLAGREDRPVLRIIWREGLQGRVELHPAQPERGDVRHLGHGDVTLQRIDGAQAGEHVGVVAAGGGDRLVRAPAAALSPSPRPRPAAPPSPRAAGTGPPAGPGTAAARASGNRPRPPRRTRPCCRRASRGWAGAHGSRSRAMTPTYGTQRQAVSRGSCPGCPGSWPRSSWTPWPERARWASLTFHRTLLAVPRTTLEGGTSGLKGAVILARDESSVGRVGVLIVGTRGERRPRRGVHQDPRRLRGLPGLVREAAAQGGDRPCYRVARRAGGRRHRVGGRARRQSAHSGVTS